jgi:hypothetical protein
MVSDGRAYEAFWVPGLDTDFDPDEALATAERWLDTADYPAGPLIVPHAVKMVENRRSLLDLSRRYPVVSPQTQNRSATGHGHAVLAHDVVGEGS